MAGLEACDDGSNDGIGCASNCLGDAAGWACVNTFEANSTCTPVLSCGNRIMEGSEACDDANGVGCLDDCSGPAKGYSCAANKCLPVCGDGKVVGNEKCDAGDLEGCTSDCSSNLDNFACREGNSDSPSICEEINNEDKRLVQIA